MNEADSAFCQFPNESPFEYSKLGINVNDPDTNFHYLVKSKALSYIQKNSENTDKLNKMKCLVLNLMLSFICLIAFCSAVPAGRNGEGHNSWQRHITEKPYV